MESNNYSTQFNTYIQQINQDSNSHSQISPNFGIHPQLISSNVYRHDDNKTIIEKLMNTRKLTQKDIDYFIQNGVQEEIRYHPTLLNLQGIQKNIFNQFINTIDEIQDIKIKIQSQKDLFIKLKVQKQYLLNQQSSYTNFIKQVNQKSTQQSIRISYSQLDKIQQQCQEMERKIATIEFKRKGQLQQLIQHQKQHYRNLQHKLNKKNIELQNNNLNTSQINLLKDRIKLLTEQNYRLEEAVNSKQVDEQLQKLKDDNQMLRKKVIEILSCQSQKYGDTEQRKRLQQYIAQQQENKNAFLQDLRKFKIEYNRLKQQNLKLKSKVKNAYKKQNKQFTQQLQENKKNKQIFYYNIGQARYQQKTAKQ